MLGQLVSRLSSQLFSPRLLLVTNTTISFGLSGLGDLIQQKIETRKQVSSVNWSRTLHMSTSFGLTSGVLCHFWYSYLDRILPGRGIRTIVTKIAWDQILFSPVCIAACILVSGGILERQTASQLVTETIQLGGRLYIAEWLFWPPAQFVNFYLLPPRFRVLYDNLVSLVYDTYTSHLKYKIEHWDTVKIDNLPSSRHYRLVLDL